MSQALSIKGRIQILPGEPAGSSVGSAAVYSPPAPYNHAIKTEEENDGAHTGFSPHPLSLFIGRLCNEITASFFFWKDLEQSSHALLLWVGKWWDNFENCWCSKTSILNLSAPHLLCDLGWITILCQRIDFSFFKQNLNIFSLFKCPPPPPKKNPKKSVILCLKVHKSCFLEKTELYVIPSHIVHHSEAGKAVVNYISYESWLACLVKYPPCNWNYFVSEAWLVTFKMF